MRTEIIDVLNPSPVIIGHTGEHEATMLVFIIPDKYAGDIYLDFKLPNGIKTQTEKLVDNSFLIPNAFLTVAGTGICEVVHKIGAEKMIICGLRIRVSLAINADSIMIEDYVDIIQGHETRMKALENKAIADGWYQVMKIELSEGVAEILITQNSAGHDLNLSKARIMIYAPSSPASGAVVRGRINGIETGYYAKTFSSSRTSSCFCVGWLNTLCSAMQCEISIVGESAFMRTDYTHTSSGESTVAGNTQAMLPELNAESITSIAIYLNGVNVPPGSTIIIEGIDAL